MRLPNAMHLLHAMWQFIACIVGTRFIASSGVGRGLAFAHSVVQTENFRRVIYRVLWFLIKDTVFDHHIQME